MIPSRFYYLLSLVFVFLIPTLVAGIFVWNRIPWPNFLAFVALITLIGGAWDVWATKHGKRDKVRLYEFNHRDTLGPKLFDLPIEEYVFFVFVSSYIVFLWEAIKFALETKNLLFFILIPCLGLWSIIFISIPYKLRMKGDRL